MYLTSILGCPNLISRHAFNRILWLDSEAGMGHFKPQRNFVRFSKNSQTKNVCHSVCTSNDINAPTLSSAKAVDMTLSSAWCNAGGEASQTKTHAQT